MDVDALLSRLDQVQGAGQDQYNARCPGHEDRQASLSIGVTNDRILLHCHAGCALGDVLLSMGLDWRDIFLSTPDPGVVFRRSGRVSIPKAPSPGMSRRRNDDDDVAASLPPAPVVQSWAEQIGVVAGRLREVKGWGLGTLQSLGVGWDGGRVTIPVRNANGDLATVMRYLPGGRPKMMALGGRGRHLFPAPEMYRPKADLWLVEGEPDAITARELGVDAVSIPGVATWKSDWTDRFEGRRVIVCFDADEEGRGAAAARLDDFRRSGVKAAAIDIAPGRDDGFDLGDAMVGALREDRVSDLRAYLGRLEREAWAGEP
jgi:hypothetical protein